MKYFINYPEDKDKKFEQFRYPAGETQVRIKPEQITSIFYADEIVVTARITDGNDLPGLAMLTDALNELRGQRWASSLHNPEIHTLILPYLPYSRADRRFVDGDGFGLKFFGKFIDSLCYDRVVTLDVHSSKARNYIANLITISPIEIIKSVYEQLPRGTKILLPDEGAKRYELEKYFKDVFYCQKKRNPKTGEILGIELPSGVFQPSDNILIVDDICDGGRTFTEIAKKMSNVTLYLYVTHGVFSKGFLELLTYFKGIYTTDSFCPKRVSGWIPSSEPRELIRIPCQGFIESRIFTNSELWQEAAKTLCQSS